MAAIATTDVTVIKTWRVNTNGGPPLMHRIVDIVLSSNGGTADDIPASYLGFKEIWYCVPILHTESGPAYHIQPMVVQTSGAGLLTINIETATDNQRSDIANAPVAGTSRVLVVGLENN